MIPVHTLAGMGLIVVSVALYGQLLVRAERLRAWLKRAPPILQGPIAWAIMSPLIVAVLAGLNLAFDFHPFGIDYRRPSTYAAALYALVPAMIFDSLMRSFYERLSRSKTYSAVSDDWMLWQTPSDESAKASP